MKILWYTAMFLSLVSPKAFAMSKGSPSQITPPSSLDYGYLPGLKDIVLGVGFELPTQNAGNASVSKMLCFQSASPIPNPNKPINQNTTFDEHVIQNTEDLKTSLGIDTTMDASYLSFSGSASLDFSVEDHVSTNDLNLVIVGSSDYGVDQLDGKSLSLIPMAQQLLDQGKYDDFKALCGDQFVSTIEYGTRLALLISIHNVSEDLKESITSNASASGGIGSFSGSLRQTINQTLNRLTNSNEVSFHIIVHGGNGIPDLATIVTGLGVTGQNVDQIEAGIRAIMVALTADKAAIVGFKTIPYPAIPWNTTDLMSDDKAHILSRMVDEYRYQSYRYDTAERLFQVIDGSSVWPSQLKQVPKVFVDAARKDMSVLNSYVLAIAQAHGACMTDGTANLSACKMPVIPPYGDFDLFWQLAFGGN